MYEEYMKKNAAYLAYGHHIQQIHRERRQSGSNDANPEYIAALRRIMKNAGVNYQTAGIRQD